MKMTEKEKRKEEEFQEWCMGMDEAIALQFELYKGDPKDLRDALNFEARRTKRQMDAMLKRLDG